MNEPHNDPLGPEPGWTECNPMKALRATRNFVHGDDGDCFRVRFFTDGKRPALIAKIALGPGAEGPPGHAHGGALLAIVDEVFGGACWSEGHKVVLARFESDMRAPVPLDQVIVVDGELASVEGRKIWVEGTIRSPEGKLFVEARCLFIQLTEAQRNGYLEHAADE